jgi:lysophospholipase L1-like esterase
MPLMHPRICLIILASFCVVFLPQGCTVQPSPATQPAAHNFARWEKAIAAFEAADQVSPPPKGAVLFIGSSTIAGWRTLAQDFPEHQVINRGFGGSEVVDATHFADRIVFPYEPRMIVFRSGGNDLHNGKSPQQVFEDYKRFVEKVHSKLPQTKIVFISWCPTIARWSEAEMNKTYNTLVQQYTRGKPYLDYVETYDMSLGPDGQPRADLLVSDKLHFNAEGYKLLVQRVRPHLAQ